MTICVIFRGISSDELARGPYLGAFADGHRGPFGACADGHGGPFRGHMPTYRVASPKYDFPHSEITWDITPKVINNYALNGICPQSDSNPRQLKSAIHPRSSSLSRLFTVISAILYQAGTAITGLYGLKLKGFGGIALYTTITPIWIDKALVPSPYIDISSLYVRFLLC